MDRSFWTLTAGTGALRPEHIRTDASNEECSKFLEEAFHAGQTQPDLDGEDSEESDAEGGKICHMLCGGLCQSSSKTASVCKMVQVFNRALLDNKVSMGSLLLLTTSSSSFLAFLGVCMQRPRLHTLVKAQMDVASDVVTFVNHSVDSLRPVVQTSHQVFNDIITDPKGCVTVEVLEYCLIWQEDGCGLTVQAAAPSQEFILDPSVKLHVRKPHRKLPFGLKFPTRKKTQTKKKKKKKKNKKSKVPKASSSSSSGHGNEKNQNQSEQHDQVQELVASLQQEESEAYGSLSVAASAAHEEKEAEVLMVECQAFKDEIVPDDDDPGTGMPLPSSSSSKPTLETQQKAPATPAPKASSFFSRKCGIDDIGFAVSNRSSCYYCKNRIVKGQVRLSWYFETRRPSSWVHVDCVKPLICRDGFRADSVQRMKQLKNGKFQATDQHQRDLLSKALCDILELVDV